MSLSYSTRNGVTTPDALTYKDASFIGNTIGSGVPILDQDVNLMNFIQAEARANLVRQQVPSGWLENILPISSSATTGAIVATGAVANKLYIGTSIIENIIVNGYNVQLYKSFTANNTVELNTAPSSGVRTDLVFLEVWLKEIKEPASSSTADRRIAGLLDDGTIPSYGNVDYYGTALREGGITNDLIDTNIGLETNRRIQAQYRIRVVDGVDIDTYEEGINDGTNVKAWPTNKRTSGDGVSETSYTFSKMTSTLNDPGLYRAGNGDATSKTNIGSLDGYVYAIPMCAVHRRNSTAYDVSTNPNGAGAAIGGTSDRPDGLFYDQVDVRDVIDLRHQVAFNGFDYFGMMERNLELLCKGALTTNFVAGDNVGLANTIHGTKHMYCEQYGGADANYVNNRSTGNNPSITSMDTNGQLVTWRDSAASRTNHSNVAQGTTSLPPNTDYGAYRSNGTGNWVLNDIITITCPSWATVDASETHIYRQDTGAEVTSDFNVSGDSSTVTCTITANPPAWTAVSNLSVVYEIEYPAGMGLVNLPTSMLKIEDASSNLIGMCSALVTSEDLSSKQAYYISATQEYIVKNGDDSRYGVGIQESGSNYAVAPSNNTVSITVPSGITISGIGYLRNITTSTTIVNVISSWSQSGTTVTINTSSGISTSDEISYILITDQLYCKYLIPTKAIIDVNKTKEVIVTLDGSGDGTTYFDYGEVGQAACTMSNSIDNIRKVSDNGIVTGTISVSSQKVTITGCSVISQDVKVTINVSKPLLNNDHLRIWYECVPYMGTGEGSYPNSNSQIKEVTLGIHTSGTGEYSSSNKPHSDVPINPHLPLSSSGNDYDLISEKIISTSGLSSVMLKTYAKILNVRTSSGQYVNEESKYVLNWSGGGSPKRGYSSVSSSLNVVSNIRLSGTLPTGTDRSLFIAGLAVGNTTYNSLRTLKLILSNMSIYGREENNIVVAITSTNSANDSYQILGRPLIKNY